jgi:murein DD-endopeptidase MepM/ murein hydrolase activator NlpD
VPPKQAQRPRHAAPKEPVQRTVLVPTVLLVAAGTAFAGLAIVPAVADDRPVQRVVAASAFTPIDVPAPGAMLPSSADVLSPTAEQVERGASQAARLAAEKAAADKAAADKAAADKAAADKAAADKAAADKAAAERAAAEAAGTPARASRDRSAAPSKPARSGGYVRPGEGRLTSGYGRRWGRLHAGIDLASGNGSPVRAVTSGKIVSAGRESGYGNVIRVRHADGTETVYAHLSRILVYGGSVATGQQIGKEGNTGRSTGPHLHFEVRVNGTPVNPVTWLRSKGVRV